MDRFWRRLANPLKREHLSNMRIERDHLACEHIDFAVYLTERHATVIDAKVTFPFVLIESPATGGATWKWAVASLILQRWSGLAAPVTGEDTLDISAFSIIDHVPESTRRHERWRLDYRRRPYLRALTKERLRDRFDELVILSLFSMIKGSPVNMPMKQNIRVIESFTHMMVEMGERAIPVTEFKRDLERSKAAAKPLKLPQPVVDWITSLDEGL